MPSSILYRAQYAALTALLGVAAQAGPARSAELTWVAPTSCPTQSEVELEIEKLLRAPLGDFDAGSFDARVRPADPGFVARLELRGDHDSRAVRGFQADSCNELVDILALSVALSLGLANSPGSLLPQKGKAGTVEPTQEATSSLEVPLEERSPQDDKSLQPNGPGSALLLSLTGDTGSLPGPALGLTAGLELAWPEIQLRLAGSWFAPRFKAVDATVSQSVGAELGLWAISLQACSPVNARTASLPLSLCGALEVGRLVGRGIGISTPRSSQSPWTALRLDLESEFQPVASSIRYFAGVGIGAPLVRNEFQLRAIGTVFKPDHLIGRAHLGVFFTFL